MREIDAGIKEVGVGITIYGKYVALGSEKDSSVYTKNA